jgi:predicted NBD/HSP70 family sugar kinase
MARNEIPPEGVGVLPLGANPALHVPLPVPDAGRATMRGFETIVRDGQLSRGELRSRLRVGLSTITATAQELLERGILVEVGRQSSTGGRPPGLLDLAPELGGVLAADIGGANLRWAVADLRGTILHQETMPTPDGASQEELRRLLDEGLGSAAARLKGPARAVAMSISGIVDPETRTISRVDNVRGWSDADVSWLARWAPQVLVDNEANLGALGEHRALGDEAPDDLLFVAVGAGIGAGLILGGELRRGASGAAGEIGLLRRGSPRRNVELERVASVPALVEAYRAAGGECEDAQEVVARAGEGDRLASRALDATIDELALGLANAVMILNPRVVVVGGGLARAGERLLEPLRARLAEFVPSPPEVVFGRLGSEAALIGAAQWAARVAAGHVAAQLGAGEWVRG